MLRVWNVINPPNKPDYYYVESIESAKKKINSLTYRQLKDRYVLSNAFGLEYYDENEEEWLEWWDDEGNSILEVMDNEEET